MTISYYKDTIPCCGVFCGGCTLYTRPKPTCRGASVRCAERKCGFYKCCVEKKGLRYCIECKTFPCSRFKKFAETWSKLGQDLITNQNFIKEFGEDKFIEYYNSKIENRK